MLHRIVAGMDAGPPGRAAVALARRLAEATDAELLLVHAYPYDLLPLEGTVAEVSVAEELHADAERLAAGLRDELAPGARTRVLPETSPARALHETCVEERADVLVVPAPLGPAALHHAPCPVLVAAGGDSRGDAGAAGPLREIGVGWDGSPPARHALELARVLAEGSGARLVALAAGAAPDAPAGVPLERLEGRPAEALAARSSGLDLLVLGSRGHGPLRRLLLGSTSERVARDAACPVLVVPEAA